MKTVSKAVAFRNLKEWHAKEAIVAFGVVTSILIQGEMTKTFSGETGEIVAVDEEGEFITVSGGRKLKLAGAAFKF